MSGSSAGPSLENILAANADRVEASIREGESEIVQGEAKSLDALFPPK